MSQHRTFEFTKMQGTGNDFIIHDLRRSEWTVKQLVERVPELCDRRYGIGGDGLIALSESEEADYRMIYRNADGSEAGMCGNGGRCIARYAVSGGFGRNHTFQVHGQMYKAEVIDSYVTLQFPAETRVNELPDKFDGYQVHPGTEHIVLPVKSPLLNRDRELRSRGRKLRGDSYFQPVGTNVNFMYGESPRTLKLKTYERGVEDLTLACGTGAIASALAWHHIQQAESGTHEFTVSVQGGELKVSFSYDQTTGSYTNLKLGGPAHFVFEGTFFL